MTDFTEDARAYYAGGFRRTFGGVPCKVFSRRTKDGRYINAKDSPFYVAEFDHPTKGCTRLASTQCEIFQNIEPEAEAEPCEIALPVEAVAAEVETAAEPSNVVAVDFAPAMVAANDEAAELQAAGGIIRGGFGSTGLRYRHPSPPAEVIPMPDNAPESPTSAHDDAPAPMEPDAPEIAPVVVLASPEPVPLFRGLRTILAAREALQAAQRRNPARERLLRRYLAMRKQRAADATKLARARAVIEEMAAPPVLSSAGEDKRRRAVGHIVRLRRQRTLDRLALAAAGDMAREARDEATRAAAKPPQHPNDETADSALIAQLHRERAEGAAAIKAAEDREAALRRAFDAATDRLADKLEEMTGRTLRAEAEVRRNRIVPAAFCGSTVATARLAGGGLQ